MERARPHYTHPERLELGVYPDQGHEVTDAMWERGVARFQRWLPV